MQTNSETLPKERRYDLFREMQKRARELGKEAFTAYSLRQTLKSVERNPANLRKDLERLTRKGLVFKGKKLVEIATYKPDGPSSSILASRIRKNFKSRLNDLVKLRLLARENTHFECQRCGRLFKDVYLVPLFPVRLCPCCLGNSKLSLGIKTRPCVIQ